MGGLSFDDDFEVRSVKTLHERNDKNHRHTENEEGEEEVEHMSTDSASDSDCSKSHQDEAIGKAGDTQKGVSFAAGSIVGLIPSPSDAAGSG